MKIFKNLIKRKSKKPKTRKFPIYIIADKISSNTQKALTLAKTKKLGEVKQSRVIYSPLEALYLIENKKAEVYFREKQIQLKKLLKILSKKDKEILTKYIVFKDLRNKGYIVKTGLKFGDEFRVYEKKARHAKWIVSPIKPTKKIDWKNFIAKNRIAHSTAKKLLIAIIDSEENVIYYEVSWLKP